MWEQTMKTQIRLLEEQSDLGLHCLSPFSLIILIKQIFLSEGEEDRSPV